MKGKAVQFGAGNIGRGFIAQLFHESGYEVVFVDVVPEVLEALRTRGAYTIRIVGKGAQDISIDRVRAVDGRDQEAVARELADCDVACTAVGAGALRHVAPNLAAGLRKRRDAGMGELNVLVCENLHEAGAYLRGLVADRLPPDERRELLARTGFVQAVVSRMVPLQSAEENGGDPLLVRVEAYKRLPVDQSAIVGRLPDIVGVVPVADFEAHEARKLYVHNCAHASMGYLGWERGIHFGYEALLDPEVRSHVEAAVGESSEALIRRYGFDRDEHAAHVADLFERFANRELGDTCLRLARDPIRKLAPGDRLLGAARLCESMGVTPVALAGVIASALRFAPPDDPSAAELQARLQKDGLAEVLRSVCGVRSDEPLMGLILDAYPMPA